MAQMAQYRGTGKRKTSIARVILRPGDGATWINGRTIEEYFPRATHRVTLMAPLKVAGAEGTYDLRVRVEGGGPPARRRQSATGSRAPSSRRTRSSASRSSARAS